jgi:Domain of unknown function (DUF6950)
MSFESGQAALDTRGSCASQPEVEEDLAASNRRGCPVTRPTARLPDWRSRLAAHIADARARSFAYGRHDCATAAAVALECSGVYLETDF